MITVYTVPNCMPCRAVKKWLDRKGIEYQVKDARENIDRIPEARQAPVVEYEGGLIHGFNVQELERLL